jgi:hypothetical protein
MASSSVYQCWRRNSKITPKERTQFHWRDSLAASKSSPWPMPALLELALNLSQFMTTFDLDFVARSCARCRSSALRTSNSERRLGGVAAQAAEPNGQPWTYSGQACGVDTTSFRVLRRPNGVRTIAAQSP